MKMRRPFALALVMALSLTTLSAAAAKTDPVAEAAQAAAGYALKYGGADSVQFALWQDGKVSHTGHAGDFSRTENRLIADDTLYGVGSVSKMYTAMAVMRLAEEGGVALDTPVTAYLPEFKMADARYQDITVRMLLNHSSGLSGSSFHNAFLMGDPQETAAADELLERLSTQSLKADPGELSVYCNDGFTLAQLVVEAVSGKAFGAYVHDAILSPAGLGDTWFPGDDFDTDRLARVYLSPTDTRPIPAETLGVHGTGGMYASASDLAAFGGLFCGDALLTRASLDAMAAPEYRDGVWPEDAEDAVAYGLGWDSVQWYPFAYSGIQALAKGGDTTAYHAGLVVLPEYNLACAVLSSGGVSTYNEMAAAKILIAALAERGVAVDEAERALPEAQRAALPEGLSAYAGLYGSSSQLLKIELASDGTMSLFTPGYRAQTTQELYYCADGAFRDETNALMVKFVPEENGQVYLWQKMYSPVPGLGVPPLSQYIMMKLPDNPVPPEVQAAWDGRSGKAYLAVSEKYTSSAYAKSMPMAALATAPEEAPGYMAFDRIVDGGHAVGAAAIPGVAGRDWQNISVRSEGGVEYIDVSGIEYVDAMSVGAVYSGPGAFTTIQSDGRARWYQVGAAAGKTMSVQIAGQGAFYVYDAQGAVTAGSWSRGDVSAALPQGGWLVFMGAPGARFHLSMTDPVLQAEQYTGLSALLGDVNAAHRAVERPAADFSSYLAPGGGFDYAPHTISFEELAGWDCDLERPLTLAQAREDLELLFQVLRSSYGPYEAFGGDAAFHAARDAVDAACAAAEAAGTLNAGVLARSLEQHLAFLEDGHFTLNNRPLGEAVISVVYTGQAFLLRDGAYVTRDGDRTVAAFTVDGGAREPGELMRLSLDENAQTVYYPWVDTTLDVPADPIVVHYTDGTQQTLTADPWHSGWTQGDELVSLHENGGVPVLTVRTMGFDEARGDTAGKQFLAYAEQLKDEPVVIVDLRANGGGNMFLPLKWLSAFTGQRVSTNFQMLMRLSMADIEASWADTANPYYNSKSDYLELGGLEEVNEDYVQFFTGPDRFVDSDKLLIVLTGKNTMSAAETFTDAAHNVENTLFIGQNTYGVLTSNAMTAIALPHSGVAVQFGGNLCLYPEGYFAEYHGFLPDLWVNGDAEALAVKLVNRMGLSQ